jgi:hypothetical protein
MVPTEQRGVLVDQAEAAVGKTAVAAQETKPLKREIQERMVLVLMAREQQVQQDMVAALVVVLEPQVQVGRAVLARIILPCLEPVMV